MSATNKFLSAENGLRHDKVAILDAGAQYGKVYDLYKIFILSI